MKNIEQKYVIEALATFRIDDFFVPKEVIRIALLNSRKKRNAPVLRKAKKNEQTRS